MTFATGSTPVQVIMLKVLVALVPGIAAYVWFFGPAIMVSIALATATALAAEAAMLGLRGVPAKPFLSDLSAVVTAWLLALSLPPLAPWWLVVTGTAFAIVVAKQLYGGLGNNLFNPAMVGWAVLIISFPAELGRWPAPSELAQVHLGFGDQLRWMFGGELPAGVKLDALTLATPLDTVRTQLGLQRPLPDILREPVFGTLAGRGAEVVVLGYLAGGLYLLQQRVIGWHIPAAFLAALALIAGGFHLAEPARFAGAGFHLAAGASILGAFFILTDPVSAPLSALGKCLYAAGAALLVWVIRSFGGYPDGIAFAVLIMNLAVPLIDLHTRPRVFGTGGGSAKP